MTDAPPPDHAFVQDLIQAFAQRHGREPRLLIAEDLEINRELLAALFRQGGFVPDLVADGAAAVAAAAAVDYDLVLMDVHMPVMNGLEATRTIRAMAPPRGRMPILALTAAILSDEIEECRKAGMNGHVGKPYERDRLLGAAVKALATVEREGGPAAG